MPDANLKLAIERWRRLSVAERRRLHLEAIPRHVSNSMATEGEPVNEEWIREQLEHHIRPLATSIPPSES